MCMPVCRADTELGAFLVYSLSFSIISQCKAGCRFSVLSFHHSNAQPKPLAKVPFNFKLVGAGKLVCAFIPG